MKVRKKLKEALEITALGTFSFDDKTNLFETSAISDAILGIDDIYMRDIQGWINLVHPDDYKHAQKLLDNDLKSVSSEFRIIRPKDLKTIWILGHAKKEHNEKGERTKITGTIQDISERKEAEKNLQLSELRLREAQSVAKIGSFERDLKQEEAWWSEELHYLFGLNPDKYKATKEAFYERVHPEDKETYANAIDNCLKTGRSFKQEFRGKHTNGEWRCFEPLQVPHEIKKEK